MIKILKPIFIASAALPLIFSCTKVEHDFPKYGNLVTVAVEDDFYYLIGDDGKTFYPGDESRIGRYDTKDKDGKRAYIYYNLLPEEKEGYDYNVALYNIIDILSKSVETAETEEQVSDAGDDALAVHHARIRGRWLDISFSLMTDNGSTHKMTLLDNRTVEAPESMPEDYQYLEFRQLGDNTFDRYLGFGYVSYDLGGYAPSVAETKGLYIRIKNLRGEVEYLKVPAAAEESPAGEGRVPSGAGAIIK